MNSINKNNTINKTKKVKEIDRMEQDVIDIATKYKKIMCKLIKNGNQVILLDCLKDENVDNNDPISIIDLAKNEYDEDERFIIHIHFCLSLLKKPEKRIIWREYFLRSNNGTNNEWWNYDYARSTFYRVRNRAIKNFHVLCCE